MQALSYFLTFIGAMVLLTLVGAETPSVNYNLGAAAAGLVLISLGHVLCMTWPQSSAIYVNPRPSDRR